MRNGCPECEYLFEERAGINEFQGGATRAQAEWLARDVPCEAHRNLSGVILTGSEADDLKRRALSRLQAREGML